MVVGSVNVDRRIGVPTLPAPGETVLATTVEQLSGGKGANQAVAAARLGRRTAFVGAIGDDEQGAWLRDRLADEGVDTEHLVGRPGCVGPGPGLRRRRRARTASSSRRGPTPA